MRLVDAATSANTALFNDGYQDFLFVYAEGTVPTTGWHQFNLVPRFYVTPPVDATWDIDFTGYPPRGNVGQVVVPVTAANTYTRPAWATAVRINCETNSIIVPFGAPVASVASVPSGRPKVRGNVLWQRDIASFDDSIQPTGTVHWSGFTPHVEMKKLSHRLRIVVEGPNQQQIENCFAQAATEGVIAGVIAAYTTAGVGLSAAVGAFTAALTNCLGNTYTVKVDNHSEWVIWDT